ncbi:phytanoyl-CoA dioxygenase family protein [Paenibacillus cymbidii]|uniref:phytanoyl-CoA dioxygenase family protein n=1 Tax=Paenibacillus cymbidii TaxID=1639034 RepID=UPI00108201E8|nr:phytanoyl-CoA dioxygenase family protein [Paenibacillus cymbidii]
MKLSKEQIDFFETFGFLKLPQLMADRLDWIIDEFTKTFPDDNKHDGTKRTCIVPFIDQRMSQLLDDPRIEAIGAALLGEDFNYMGSDGNYYSGDTSWHRDGYHKKYKHLKIAFYLDELDGNSGALRVIPGSHRLHDQFGEQLSIKMRDPKASWNIAGNAVPAYVLDVTPGDVLVFNHNTFHSSWNGSTSRRMFTINMCQRYEEADLQELRDYIAGAARFWIDRNYSETMMNTASPQRMIHLEQVMANDGHLAALSAQKRLEMTEPARG